MKKLVVFGDSWPAGAELRYPEQDRFPTLIGSALNIEVDNQSEQGTSTDQALLKFLNYDLTDCGVLFCFTSYARYIRFDKEQALEVHPNNKDLASLSYYAGMYTDELGKFNFVKNILLVQSICSKLNIPLYCITNWNDVPKHKLIDSSLFYNKSFFEILGMHNVDTESSKNFDFGPQMARNTQYIYPHSGHPNISGHKLIAEELTTWINSR